jgi:hypothetical protein
MLVHVAGGHERGNADNEGSSAALRRAALDAAVLHLVDESRAWLLSLELYLDEIGSLHDDSAARVVEALDLTLSKPPRPGTLRHVEQAASELLRTLTELRQAIT